MFYQRLPLRERRPEALTPSILQRANIGEDYWDVGLDIIPDHLAYKNAVDGYLLELPQYERAGAGLLFSGPHGSGKTALGCIVLREALMRGGRCWKTRASVMVSQLWASKPVTLPNGCPLREALENINFLFLDDFEIFGKAGDGTGPKDRCVEEVLYARHERRLPTLLATNLGWDRLKGVPYLKSLLKDRYYFIEVSGINWRESSPTPTAT